MDLPGAYLCGERATNRLGFLGDDGEQDARCAVGTAAALLPRVDGGDVEPEAPSECPLGKAHRLPNPGDIERPRAETCRTYLPVHSSRSSPNSTWSCHLPSMQRYLWA